MNLIEDSWIPARRRSGKIELIAPWQITDGFDKNPFAQIAAPRPDFNGALVQFLIGLLQTCFAPEDGRQWRQRLELPPGPTELKELFFVVGSSFCLDGQGAKFMQDLNLQVEISSLELAAQEKRMKPVGDLLVELPSGKKLEDNTDLFVKRGRVAVMCPECAASALFTLQTNAPSGGQGHRTGIRGGGPLTSVVLGDSLWATCWLNVLEREEFLASTGNASKDAPADHFPWLATTRTSEDGYGTTPEDAHPDQVFWAMPRRMHLLFSEVEAECDLCSRRVSPVVRNYQTKNLGINYDGPWRHPLSPYFIAKDGLPSPIHPQPGGIGYRHWLGFVQGVDDGKVKRVPAAVVDRYLRIGAEDLRLWAFGYDMDNMKARCWYDSTMPLIVCPNAIREDFTFRVAAVLKGAEEAAYELRMQLKKALFKPGADVKGDLSFVTARFWQETEPDFYATLPRIREVLLAEGDLIAILEGWHRLLIGAAEQIFDDVSQTGDFDAADPKRIALAWRDLRMALYGKKMRQTLGLPDKPSTGSRKKGGKKQHA